MQRYLFIFVALIAILQGCKPTPPESKDTIESDSLIASSALGGAGIWAVLSPAPQEGVGVILGFQSKAGMTYAWVEKPVDGRPKLAATGKGIPIPSHAGWQWAMEDKKNLLPDCETELLDTLGWGFEAPLQPFGLAPTPDKALQLAKKKNYEWGATHAASCDSMGFLKDEILWASGEILCIRHTEWPKGRKSKEFQRTFSLDPATGDTIQMKDFFSSATLQTAAGLTSRDLGKKWLGEPIPLKPGQIQLAIKHHQGQFQASGSYTYTFETSAIEGRGNLGPIPEALDLPSIRKLSWDEIKEAYGEAEDAFIAPEENLVVIETFTQIWIIDPLDGDISLSIPKQGRLVMVQFGLDHNLGDWPSELVR